MRPSNLIYSVDEKPPALVCLVNAAQQLTIITPFLVYPILVMRGVGADEQAVANFVGLSFLAVGIGTLLQAWPAKWTGSGFLISSSPAAAFVPIDIAAIKAGGVPLLTGMTCFAGFAEIAFAQIVRRFRPFFPAEISGLCILLIGIYVGVLAIKSAFGLDASAQATVTSRELVVGGGTLALMIGLNLWAKGTARMLCAIIGVICGYAAAVALGAFDPAAMKVLTTASIFALPQWTPALPHFSAELAVPFAAAALVCTLRAMGDVATGQKINDRDWIRPDMTSIRKGIVSDGAATVAAGLLGVLGCNTQSSANGMANATGVASRNVAFWLGAMLIVFAFFPVIPAALVAMPRAVVGASFLFTGCFIMISGLQIITSRLLDARRTFIIGIALTLSLGHEIFPALYNSAPTALAPFLSSGLVTGLIIALVLNAVFRIGMRSKATAGIAPGPGAHDAVRAFLEQQGARWGARRDVIERAIFGTAQAEESIVEHCSVQGPVSIEASFDEFNLDIRLSWRGDELTIPDKRPSDEEIRETEQGLLLLAGFLIQRNADRVRTARRGDRAVLEFHFQH
ncbi:MAG TPA: solute carrier family 23 protein [Xanthobacteraceae bacterium]